MKWYWWTLIGLLIIFLVGRYFISGKGNKGLICPTTFGFGGWDKDCVEKQGYIILNNETIIKK